MNTKFKILYAALQLFSEKGFEAVSVRDIAGAVGLRESSLYNHFRNKQDIFDSVVEWCWKQAEAYFQGKAIPFSPEDDLSLFWERDFEKLTEIVLRTFGFFFEDEVNVMFRRLLVLSQFENARAKELYRKLYRDYPLEIQTRVFTGLMESGAFHKSDPAAAALEFYGAVFLLIHTCDGLEEAKPKLKEHLRQFVAHHQIPEPFPNR